MPPKKTVSPPSPAAEPVPPKPTGSAKARRSAARLAAVQALYQIELGGTPSETAIGEFVRHRLGQEIDGDRYVSADPQLFADIVRGVMARQADVDQLVTGVLDRQWGLDRMEPILRAILRAGAWELLGNTGVAPHIVINDYIDVGHAFFAGREPGMVNGVLDRIARQLRPEEMATRETRR
ncbi:transcription antitermination factor NusB [Rhodospirillum centenum]|uniref:Transcription antitermination protein NusB n=1 Tax=Rhodospirillum centenum (strain ATCC 51521 / SW) TaxID=414684 RepID=B6IMS4_RHOCS|nr:transcription antitermination factor NusB [Rhodospirillum centenum]ACI98740.1 transcription antitermination protein NusB, putative [Rhodospirillum centenum SW]